MRIRCHVRFGLVNLAKLANMSETRRFPSVEWLNAVRDVFNTTESYRGAGGGQCDCTVGLKINEEIYIVEFEGFGCSSIQDGTESALSDVDFYIEMPMSQWQDMLENIASNGHAIGEHTLNTIDLGSEEGIAHSKHEDQYRQDLFVRYNQTLQFFFDASHRVETTFENS